MTAIRVGLIGDYQEEVPAHRAIPRALEIAAASLGGKRVETTWLPTETLAGLDAALLHARLSAFDGLWGVPASPYADESGALAGIRFARENAVPYLGTCAGFQHALLEYAHNVLGLTDAEHAEIHPGAAVPLLAPLSCALVETDGRILLAEGSRLREVYGRAEVSEPYHCCYGLNPAYQARFDEGRLRISGRDGAGEVRAVELDGDAFFVACLFQPERAALRGEGHPLVRAYVEAILRGPRTG